MDRISYHVAQYNALGRAAPKLLRKMYNTHPEKPAWEEAFHAYEAVKKEWLGLRRQIAEECAPWFDGSAFIATDRQANDG